MIQTAHRDPLAQIEQQMRQLMSQLTQWQHGDFCPPGGWRPAVNIYELPDRLEVCVDVAGVTPGDLDVRVESGRLTVQGTRRPPEPRHGHDRAMRIVGMEIDHGPFRRSIALPDAVDLDRVSTQYRQGMLWIHLPLKER